VGGRKKRMTRGDEAGSGLRGVLPGTAGLREQDLIANREFKVALRYLLLTINYGYRSWNLATSA